MPITDPSLLLPATLAFLLCSFAVILGLANKQVFLSRVDAPGWSSLFNWVAKIAPFGLAVFAGTIDWPDAIENGFPPHARWALPGLIFFLGAQIFVIQILLSKTRERQTDRAAFEKIGGLLERHEQRRQQIGEIVNAKAQKVRQARKEHDGASTTPDIRQIATAFQPKDQIILNAIALHGAIRRLIGSNGNLRVAVFFPTPDGSQLKLFFSFDGRNHDCITTPNGKHAERFKLGCAKKCLALTAARVAGVHVIGDTTRIKKVDRDKFEHFDQQQKQNIKSIAAYGYKEDDARPNAVITADSDRKQAFRDDDGYRKLLEVEFQEFGSRLLFEADVLNLFRREG